MLDNVRREIAIMKKICHRNCVRSALLSLLPPVVPDRTNFEFQRKAESGEETLVGKAADTTRNV
jgi:hypothetical protein